MKLRFSILLVCTICFCKAQSTKVTHTIFSKQDGIELDQINSIVLDNDEFLWLGGGILDSRVIIHSEKKLSLQRFNGRTFHNIPIPVENDGYMVHQLHKRQDGAFYVNLQTRLFVFDPVTIQFTEVKLPYGDISKVYHYNGADYFLGQKGREITLNKLKQNTFEPLYSFDRSENKYLVDGSTTTLTCFEEFCIIGDDNFPMLAIKWDGTIVKTWDRYYAKNPTTSKRKKRYIDESFSLNNETYSFLWANPHLHKVNEDEILLESLTNLEHRLLNEHLQIFTDPLGQTIIGTGHDTTLQLSSYDPVQGFNIEFVDTEFGTASPIELVSKNVKEDVWLAVNNELHHFKFPKKSIKTYLEEYALRSIIKWDDHAYLVSTDGHGWHILNIRKQETEPFEITVDGSPILPTSSRGFFKIGETLWSNSGADIIEIDLPTKSAKSYRHHPINSMVKPTDSTIIYGTKSYHLMEFNMHTKLHRSLVVSDSLDIVDVAYDSINEKIIAGTDKGLLVYNLTDGTHSFFNDEIELKDPYILSVEYHKNYGYLLGTRKGHIVSFSPENEVFTSWYEDELSAGIASILFDEERWWINTFNGLVSFDPKSKAITRFSTNDGLSHNEGNRYSALDTGEGFLMGSIAGLNYFDPKTLNTNELDSEIKILRIRNYNVEKGSVVDELNRSNFSLETTVVLPAEFKELQIDYALSKNLDYKEHRFKYRLNDEDWITVNNEQSIRFPNLAAGNYTLEIEASDFSGKRIGEPLVLSIDSKDFFYKTWWFYLVLSIGSVLLLLYFLKQALEKRRRQEKFSEALLNSQEMERTRISKELHDSVGQQLTLIKRKAQLEELGELSNLTNQALEEVRSISRGLYPANLKILGLTESLEQLVLDFDEQTPIFFSSEMDTIDSYFDKDESLHVYRFVQECLSNILKHAKAQAVSLTVSKSASHIVVVIEDNGIGFDVSESIRKNSLGIKTITERIRILKGLLTIDSTPKKGTVVSAEIPL